MLDEKTKERIALEAAFKADDGMAHWSPIKGYIAGAEAEAERSSGQWISVEKQLPELTEPLMWYNDENVLEVGIENYKATVLAFHPQAGIYKAVLTKTTGWSEISTISNRALIPTHWRPLPEPPIQ